MAGRAFLPLLRRLAVRALILGLGLLPRLGKSALLLAVILAACFTMTGAEAAKKKAAAKPPAKPADAAYDWNLKNMPPMAAPGAAAGPAAEKKAAKPKKKAKA